MGLISLIAALGSGVTAAQVPTAPPLPPLPPLPEVPPEHPRLYLRAPQVAELPRRLAHPVLPPVVARLEKSTGSQRMRSETQFSPRNAGPVA